MLNGHLEALSKSATQVSLMTKAIAGLAVLTGVISPILPPLIPVTLILGSLSGSLVFLPPRLGSPQAAGDQHVIDRLVIVGRSLP